MLTNPITFWRIWWHGLNVFEQTVAVALFAATIVIILVTPAGAQVSPDVSNNAVWVAVIAAIPVMLTGPLIAWMNERSRRKDREEDRIERAAVARRAEERGEKANETVKRVAANTAETVLTAKDTNQRLVAVAKTTGIIHTLVNSQLTASKQNEFDSITRELILLMEKAPSEKVTAAIAKAEAALAELRAVLADRKIVANDVNKQELEQNKI